jgi:hypothetical protein
MGTADDTERELRLELMHLDRKLKLQDLRRLDQRLAFEPIKMLLLAAGVVGFMAFALMLSL